MNHQLDPEPKAEPAPVDPRHSGGKGAATALKIIIGIAVAVAVGLLVARFALG